MQEEAEEVGLFLVFFLPNKSICLGGVYFEELFKNWIKHRVLLPMTYSFLFGLTSCTSATIRDQDDTFNWIAGIMNKIIPRQGR